MGKTSLAAIECAISSRRGFPRRRVSSETILRIRSVTFKTENNVLMARVRNIFLFFDSASIIFYESFVQITMYLRFFCKTVSLFQIIVLFFIIPVILKMQGNVRTLRPKLYCFFSWAKRHTVSKFD